MAKKQPNKGKVKKVSQKENAAPNTKGHEGEIWHKPFSYKTKAGVTIKVEGHWERKAGSGPKPKVAKAPKLKAVKKEKPKRQGKSHWAKVVAKGGELGQDPSLFHQDAEGRMIPNPPQGVLTFYTAKVAVGEGHHEAEQAAARSLEKLKAAKKPVAVPPVTTE